MKGWVGLVIGFCVGLLCALPLAYALWKLLR